MRFVLLVLSLLLILPGYGSELPVAGCQLPVVTYQLPVVSCQLPDSTTTQQPITPTTQQPIPPTSPYRFKATDLIVPAAFVGLGIAGLEWKGLKRVNQRVDDALWHDGSHGKIKLDNYTEFLPAVATYGLNLCGVKGLHGYADLSIIMGTAYLMMAAIVYPVKDFVYAPRPGGAEGFNSFPSGHTAWAFTGAEIMRREFWHVSPWIGVSGYLVATGTAFMRLYNGAHWLTDVLAGAGIGILCAEAAYWLYPTIAKHLFPSQYATNLYLSPTATYRSLGLSLLLTF